MGGIVQSKECPCVPSTNRAALDHLLHLLWQREDAEKVGDRRAILPYCLSDLLLRQAKFIDQLAVAARLFNGVQVRPLKILDER